MKEIPLTQGKVALVDDEDFERLNQYSWCADKSGCNWYARTNVKIDGKYRTLKMHREILNAPEGMPIDHIDRNGLNNQKSNLRICTNVENGFNRKKYDNNTSGHKGVFWSKQNRKWEAKIGVKGKRIYLGSYETKEEAYKVYKAAARVYFGEFCSGED